MTNKQLKKWLNRVIKCRNQWHDEHIIDTVVLDEMFDYFMDLHEKLNVKT